VVESGIEGGIQEKSQSVKVSYDRMKSAREDTMLASMFMSVMIELSSSYSYYGTCPGYNCGLFRIRASGSSSPVRLPTL
jgi:hypothetical protein